MLLPAPREVLTADFTDHADSKGKILHIDGPELYAMAILRALTEI